MKHFVLKIELCGVCGDSVLHPGATQCLCECRRKCKVIARAGRYLQKGWMDGLLGNGTCQGNLAHNMNSW